MRSRVRVAHTCAYMCGTYTRMMRIHARVAHMCVTYAYARTSARSAHLRTYVYVANIRAACAYTRSMRVCVAQFDNSTTQSLILFLFIFNRTFLIFNFNRRTFLSFNLILHSFGMGKGPQCCSTSCCRSVFCSVSRQQVKVTHISHAQDCSASHAQE